MIRNTTSRRSERGFTLAEIMVTTAIFAVIMIAALAVYDKSNRIYKSSTEAADLQQSTRIAFDKLVSDLRIAGFDYNRGGTPNVVNAPAWAISTFYPINSQVDVGNGLLYTCVQAGTSAASAPSWSTTLGGTTTDGTVKWVTASNGVQYAQQDEQLEYVGQNALVFRANFDYFSDPNNGNGLENYDTKTAKGDSEKINYTPMDATSNTPIFPYVTTGNDEIVIYALRSNDASKNTGSMSFWADVTAPRSAYPPGGKEKQVTVTGIDTTNDNPPYSLVRMTVANANTNTWVINAANATPIAENIRSLQFYYYSDYQGTTILKDAANADIANGANADGTTFSAKDKAGNYTGAVGGDGQWDATNVGGTSNYSHRNLRSNITSVRVSVVGMGSAPEPGYTNATETIASIQNYKEYTLSSLVVPRNLGLTGFPEPSYKEPSPPTITGMCIGHCAAPVIFWDPPTSSSPVYQYQIESDTTSGFTAPNLVTVLDPSATSYILPDDGTDPSVLHYYRMYAVNDNGRSLASDPPYQVKPQNTTKPQPPSNLAASTNQANQITLTWTAPALNDASKNSLSCSAGASSSGASIPTQESIRFKIWRGTTSSFDPTAGQGVLILDTTDQSQPGGSPGAPVTWIDTGAVLAGHTKPNSQLAPAACITYYYRIQAVDRCVAPSSGAANKSGSINDSMSTIFPTGQIQFFGLATNATTPAAPVNLAVDLTNSWCPPPHVGTNCNVVLTWAKVTTDTAGNAVGVDTYRITRFRKKIFQAGWTVDPNFPPLDVSGFSVTGGAQATWTDTSGPYKDPSDDQKWYYEYTVAAKVCTTYSAESNTADYPVQCTTNPNITPNIAAGVTGTGDSPAAPWVFAYNDSITVTNSGSPITSVVFNVSAFPSGTSFFNSTVNASTATMSWPSTGSDLQIYEVDITITTAGCTETRIKFVQDSAAANCALQLTTTSAVSESTAGSIATAVVVYTIRNTGTEALTINKITSPTVQGTTAVTWHDPDGVHSDMTFKNITYAGSVSDSFVSPASGTIGTSTLTTTRNVPAGLTTLAGGGSMNISLSFQYAKKLTTLSLKPPTKICFTYGLASENYVLKHCNIVGQAVSTANPSSCD